MTNTELLAKIKAEIERLKKTQEVSEDKDYAQYELDVACGYDMACDDILSFLSILESEKPMNQDELEKEMNRYFNDWQNVQCEEDCSNEGGFCCVLNGELKPVSLFHCRKIARHFAQWQREQMMKEAVETVVSLDAGGFPFIEFGVEKFGLKVRDKVHIIIIKDDGKSD